MQPLIDFAITYYSKAEKNFSHILGQDKNTHKENKAALSNITDRDKSIDLHTPGRPYIVMLFDVGVDDKEAGITATWGDKTQDDRCLRIHVRGFTQAMYPFVDKISGLRQILDDLRFHNRAPPPSLWPDLRAKASWGQRSDVKHLRWERNTLRGT
jgi:hypothetical protein